MIPLPMLPEDKTTLLGLLSKYASLWRATQADNVLKAQTEARIAAQNDTMDKLHATFSVYGFNTKTEGFPLLRDAVGWGPYADALIRGGYAPDEVARVPPRESANLIAPEKTAQIVEESPSDATVRDLALEYLKAAGAVGTKAAKIRDFIEQKRGAKLHEKTAGMTLYRLSQDGLARRDGRTWFFVSPTSETKNPGAENAGAQ